MDLRTATVCGALITVLLCAGCRQTASGPARTPDAGEAGFLTIFDGRSMDGWEIYIEPSHERKEDAFYLEDGALACKGYGHHWFRYTEPLSDFVLRLEFRIARDSNSGICLRSAREGAPPFTGFEVQICDDIGRDPGRHSTGAIYDVVTPMFNASRPLGQWNEMEITVRGLTVVVVLNGLKVIDTDFACLTEPIGKFDFAYANMPRSGYLALQDHWTPVWYRNIRLRKL